MLCWCSTETVLQVVKFYTVVKTATVYVHHYINTSLFITHAFTPRKDYSPKRQFF